ncbi:MAG: D-aminoacyl-tRNA deacylase [Synergistaceae bacterium]|nr:D-aminoacyl-tRNA deacylase [Synergistaceae bacterium]
MRAVIQKVREARAIFDGELLGEIKLGLCVLLGVRVGDTEKEVAWMAEKLVNLRVFEDGFEKLNRSLLDVKGEMLLISQFTVYGDCRKGRRPSFTEAAPPDEAKRLYELTVEKVKGYGVPVKTGKFQTHMIIELANDGPVTLIIETPKEIT